MDKVFISDLAVRCILGTEDWERRERQEVLIGIVIHADLQKAGASDRLEDAVDYRAVKKEVLAMAERSEYRLVEALAERVATICLTHPAAVRVDVRIEKPGALRFARSSGVEITRERGAGT
jgi:FolB domain-containing protein